MASKAEIRRRKKAAHQFPALNVATKPKPHRVGGKFARDDDPRKTALQARERQLGGKGRRNIGIDATAPVLACEIGYVLQSECKPDEVSKLWDVWQAYCAAERTYRIRYIGQTGEPKGASIQMVPDAMQADQSMRVDMRTQDERDTQAVSGWMRWQGYLGQLPTGGASVMRQAERGNGKPLWYDGAPTGHGLIALIVLRSLAVIAAR